MMSVVILAGGLSTRMGADKAFLQYNGKYFVELVKDQATKVSSDILIAVGERKIADFEFLLSDSRVKILHDRFKLSNPLGGMFTGFREAKNAYIATIACDHPKIRSEVLEFLYEKAQNQSAAVPVWEADKIEPLCAVYNVNEAISASARVIQEGTGSPRNMVAALEKVIYVSMSEIRRFDKDLDSFYNINSMEDYSRLRKAR